MRRRSGPATSAFLEATNTIDPPAAWASSTRKASRPTRKYPVPRMLWLRFHSASVRLGDRRRGGDPCVGDDDVDPAEAVDGGREGGGDRILLGHVTGRGGAVLGVVGRGGSRSVGVDVEPDHRGAGGVEGGHDRTADAAGRAGDEGDLALELTGGRQQAEFVELQGPVLDGEGLGCGQGDELRQPVGTGHHLDGPVIEVPADLGPLDVRADGDETDVLDEHHARVGIAHLVGDAGVVGEVLGVLVAVPGHPGADAVPERVQAIAGRVIGDPQGDALGVDEMVGAGGADLGEGRGVD